MRLRQLTCQLMHALRPKAKPWIRSRPKAPWMRLRQLTCQLMHALRPTASPWMRVRQMTCQLMHYPRPKALIIFVSVKSAIVRKTYNKGALTLKQMI
jgi:hypothetical protein